MDGITVNTRSKLRIVVSHQDHLKPITCEAANVAMRTPINKSTEISVLCKCSDGALPFSFHLLAFFAFLSSFDCYLLLFGTCLVFI